MAGFARSQPKKSTVCQKPHPAVTPVHGRVLFVFVFCLVTGAGFAMGEVGHPVPDGEAPHQLGGILTIESPESAQHLHQKSRRVSLSDPSIPVLVERMKHLMMSEKGDGIAAIQLGVPLQIVLLKRQSGDRQTEVLLNPEIVRISQRRAGSWERCLSVPWGYRYLRRPIATTVRYQTISGQVRVEQFKYGESAILHQELEHLRGHLLSDGFLPKDFIPPGQIAKVSPRANSLREGKAGRPEHRKAW